MYIQYGSYSTALQEAAVATQKTPLLAEDGTQYGVEETWTITGFKTADTTTALITALNALETAFSFQGRDIYLKLDDGTVARFMRGVTPLGGTRVIGGVSFPEDGQHDAEFSTFRRYQVVVKGVYQVGNQNVQLIRWDEILAFTGGGPRFGYLQTLNGFPQKQLLAQATPFMVSQQGSAVGLLSWPIPPIPLWPAAEHIDRRRVTYRSPKRTGGGSGPVFVEYGVEWGYEFEDALPLVGKPTYWR